MGGKTIDKRERNYIEFEMSKYEDYKLEIALERQMILEGGSKADGQPRGSQTNSPTETKAVRLTSSTALLRMEKVIRAVDVALSRFGPLHRKLFYMFFISGRRDYYAMCDELHVSVETFRRYKRQLIAAVGVELGIIRDK